jgi:hypothetical protein
MKYRFSQYLRDLARVERYAILRPYRDRMKDRRQWVLDRHSVARGVAIGFFFGILTPVAQILFALVAAIVLRANPVVTAASTLITNPFTFPVIYYAAYRIGSFITGRSAATESDIEVSEEAAERALDVAGWFPTLIDWFSTIGPPLAVGVVTLALMASLIGYAVVHAVWSLVAMLRVAKRT